MRALSLTEGQQYSTLNNIHNQLISKQDCEMYILGLGVLPILVLFKNEIRSATNQWLLKLYSNLQHHSEQPFWYFRM